MVEDKATGQGVGDLCLRGHQHHAAKQVVENTRHIMEGVIATNVQGGEVTRKEGQERKGAMGGPGEGLEKKYWFVMTTCANE